jgi:tRNA-dihydrouridine synthase
MLARGALGNPWLFEQVLGIRSDGPTAGEVLAELDWVIECASEHMGVARAVRYLRRFYPWYLQRLGFERARERALQSQLQQAPSFHAVTELLHGAVVAQPV